MAEHRWTSSVDASWAATGSWHSGVVPGNGDTALFGEFGTGNVTGGLNQSAIDLAAIKILPLYAGDIATSGSPLRIAADKVVHQGSGAIHLKGDTGQLDLIIFDVDQRAGITTQSTLDGILADIMGRSGNVLVKSTVGVVSRVYTYGPRMYFEFAESEVNRVTEIQMAGGEILCKRAATGKAAMNGGILTLTLDILSGWNLTVFSGTFAFNPTDSLSTTGNVQIFDGTLDLSGLARVKVYNSVILGPGATVIDPNDTIETASLFIDLRKELP